MMQNPSDKRNVAETFRNRMQLLIGQRNQSLSSFAASVGLDRSALSQFLAPGSTRLPRAETLTAISRTCGVSLDWLLGLIASDDVAEEKAPMLEIQHINNNEDDGNRLLANWHSDALGYKIRYVPATLPDLLRIDAVSKFEFSNYSREQVAAKAEASKEQLDYSRRPETDMEVCLPVQRLEALAKGTSHWQDLPQDIRHKQLSVMADLIDEMYPTFRLFLFDGRKLYTSPYTVFGPKRAAMYIGNMYLVINSAEHIKSLTAHFDNLIRISDVSPDRAAAHIRRLLK